MGEPPGLMQYVRILWIVTRMLLELWTCATGQRRSTYLFYCLGYVVTKDSLKMPSFSTAASRY
jgi:hypothetical protein